MRLTAATAGFFTYNPLLHVGVGGCFLPAETDVPLGTGYQLDILDGSERVIMRCKAKVAAKQAYGKIWLLGEAEPEWQVVSLVPAAAAQGVGYYTYGAVGSVLQQMVVTVP